MAEQLKKILDEIKRVWSELAPKTKGTVKFITAAVLVFAVVLTLLINIPKLGYKVVFPGMSSSEAATVYATLLEMGVQPQIDDNGNVRVPADRWDDLQYELSAQGYPKTTLSYDTFSSMSGFTTTEFEKRVALVYQLQDRLQSTFKRWEGISDAAVTITIPEDSNFVWNQNQQQSSSASVTITMRPGYSLSREQVSAIKNHTASSVPKLEAKDVVVVDAATGVEIFATYEGDYYGTRRLEFERELEKALEDNVKRLLAPSYGANGVTAVAKVVVDYDKMVKETKEVLPMEDGEGVVEHIEEHYETGQSAPYEGVVGEVDNTDIPRYPNLSGLDENQINVFDRITDYDIGYILTQIERGEPWLKEASIAVLVDEAFLDRAKEELLVGLISSSTNIAPESIKVSNLEFKTIETGSSSPARETNLLQIIILAGIALVLLLILIITIMVLLRRRKRRKEEEARLAEEALEAQRRMEREKEISDHKKMLYEEAQASANPKEDAIKQEIREFAEHNPEITANLIRSLMKEER